MRDFPVFSTYNGVGSLTLSEIPYRGCAYLTIQQTSDANHFLQECVSFCKAVGAVHLYASGHDCLKQYPHYTDVISMQAVLPNISDCEACLFPVTEETSHQWKEIYNEKMKNVPNSAYMTEDMALKIAREGSGYFVHRDGQLLGIGAVHGHYIDMIASVLPGAGREVLITLCQVLPDETVSLEVASANKRAVRFYNRMGFVQQKNIRSWHKIF